MSLLSGAVVVDAEGRVAASWPRGTELARIDAGNDASIRLELPGGAAIVLRRHDGATGWFRFARAFVHEVRSPLNALAIYLDLASARLKPGAPKPPTATPIDEVLEKATNQVRRIDELLKAFGILWSPADLAPEATPADANETDLAHMVRVAVRFGENAAMRLSVRIEADLCDRARVQSSASDLADALVVLLVEAMEGAGAGEREAMGEGVVQLRLHDDGGVRLELRARRGDGQPVASYVKGERALIAAGASVERIPGGVMGVFR